MLSSIEAMLSFRVIGCYSSIGRNRGRKPDFGFYGQDGAVSIIVHSDDYEDHMSAELELLSVREASTAEEQEVCDTGDAVALIVDSDDYEDDMPELCSLSSDDSCSEEDQLSKDY